MDKLRSLSWAVYGVFAGMVLVALAAMALGAWDAMLGSTNQCNWAPSNTYGYVWTCYDAREIGRQNFTDGSKLLGVCLVVGITAFCGAKVIKSIQATR